MNNKRSEDGFVFNNEIKESHNLRSSEKDHLSEVLMDIPKDDLIIMLLYHGENGRNSNISSHLEIKVVNLLSQIEKEKIVKLIIEYRNTEDIEKRVSDISGLKYNKNKDESDDKDTDKVDESINVNKDEGDDKDTDKVDESIDVNKDEGDDKDTDKVDGSEYELDYEFGQKFLIKKTSKSKGIGEKINLRLIKDMNIEKVIFIRYHKLPKDEIKKILKETEKIHLINVGCSQTLPSNLKSKVEVTEIQKPRDLKRLGILSTGAVRDTEHKKLLSFDDIDTLIKYVGIEKLFKFLHMFLSKATDSKAIAKLSINKESTDIKNLNTINPLFDDIVDFE